VVAAARNHQSDEGCSEYNDTEARFHAR